MKKNINYNNSKRKKNILIIIISISFLIYISLVFSFIKRDYFLIEDILKSTSSYVNSFFINKLYKNDLDMKKVNDVEVKRLQKENDDLRKMIDFKSKTNLFIIAEVVNHKNLYWNNKLEINKGNRYITKNSVVLNDNGLIGFISKVGNNVSEVSLITGINENNMLSVKINSNGNLINGILKKYDKKNNLFIVGDIISKDKINKGDSVMLSGYENSTYKDIYVGSVADQKEDNISLTKTLYVKSDVDFNDLLYVVVKEEQR